MTETSSATTKNIALERLRVFEGGFSDDPVDQGGATRFGISLRFLRSQGIDIDGDGDTDVEDVKALSPTRADQLMLTFCHPYYDLLKPQLSIRVFDHAVNAGGKAAFVVLQRTLEDLGLYKGPIDGAPGPKTKNAVELSCNLREDVLVAFFNRRRVEWYVELVVRKPELIKFLKGWTRRALS